MFSIKQDKILWNTVGSKKLCEMCNAYTIQLRNFRTISRFLPIIWFLQWGIFYQLINGRDRDTNIIDCPPLDYAQRSDVMRNRKLVTFRSIDWGLDSREQISRLLPVLSQRYYLTKNHKQVTFRGDVLTEAWIPEKKRSHTWKSLHPWNHWRQHTDQMRNMEWILEDLI